MRAGKSSASVQPGTGNDSSPRVAFSEPLEHGHERRRGVRADHLERAVHDGTTTLPTTPTEKFVFGRKVGRR